MLGGSWLAITLALLIAEAATQEVLLLLIALLFFLAGGVSRVWAKYALARVTHTRKLSANRAFFGETITVEIGLENRKLLPLPWVQVEDEISDKVKFLQGHISACEKPTRELLNNFFTLGWYHRITRKYPVQCVNRGLFMFGPATVRSGDLFGFFRQEQPTEGEQLLTVYPKLVPLERLGIPSRHPFGDLRVRRHLFEDPVMVSTIRDYSPGDPLKRIHWKATARTRRLQTRVFERTTTVDLALYLDVRTAPPPLWSRSEQLLELGVMTIASIADHALSNDIRVGFYANESFRHSGRGMISMAPSDHPEHRMRILEALAHIQGWPVAAIDEHVEQSARNLPWDATVCVVSAQPTEDLLVTLRHFRRAGRRVALVLVGNDAAAVRTDGFVAYRVSEEVYWQELTGIALGVV